MLYQIHYIKILLCTFCQKLASLGKKIFIVWQILPEYIDIDMFCYQDYTMVQNVQRMFFIYDRQMTPNSMKVVFWKSLQTYIRMISSCMQRTF